MSYQLISAHIKSIRLIITHVYFNFLGKIYNGINKLVYNCTQITNFNILFRFTLRERANMSIS